jgi:hypothetical protein
MLQICCLETGVFRAIPKRWLSAGFTVLALRKYAIVLLPLLMLVIVSKTLFINFLIINQWESDKTAFDHQFACCLILSA